MQLTIATCGMPVSGDVDRNASWVVRQLRRAHALGAHVAHFPEACLSGYAGVNVETFAGYDWDRLEARTREVFALAGELGMWLVVGSAHRLGGRKKPHNCVYIVDDRGQLIDRYDKLFCAGDRAGRTGDLAHYSPGSHFAVFTIRDLVCGALICHDYRYPELYREYKRRGVQVMFHSYHAGDMSPATWRACRRQVGESYIGLNAADTLPGITMPATMQSYAGNSFVWISCSNTSARQSCWPSLFVRPDGVITGKLRLNRPGVLVSHVDPRAEIYDSTVAWRMRAIDGVFHSGKQVEDPRSRERKRI